MAELRENQRREELEESGELDDDEIMAALSDEDLDDIDQALENEDEIVSEGPEEPES